MPAEQLANAILVLLDELGLRSASRTFCTMTCFAV